MFHCPGRPAASVWAGYAAAAIVCTAPPLPLQAIGQQPLPAPAEAKVDLSGHTRRVRPIGFEARTLLADAQQRSATVRSLVAGLDRSDVIVYLQRGIFDRADVEGRTSLIAAVPEARFVRVMIRSGLADDGAVEMLGHELQHVNEIASERRIRSESSLLQYLRVIGFECGTGRFETEAATTVERQVRVELGLGRRPRVQETAEGLRLRGSPTRSLAGVR